MVTWTAHWLKRCHLTQKEVTKTGKFLSPWNGCLYLLHYDRCCRLTLFGLTEPGGGLPQIHIGWCQHQYYKVQYFPYWYISHMLIKQIKFGLIGVTSDHDLAQRWHFDTMTADNHSTHWATAATQQFSVSFKLIIISPVSFEDLVRITVSLERFFSAKTLQIKQFKQIIFLNMMWQLTVTSKCSNPFNDVNHRWDCIWNVGLPGYKETPGKCFRHSPHRTGNTRRGPRSQPWSPHQTGWTVATHQRTTPTPGQTWTHL